MNSQICTFEKFSLASYHCKSVQLILLFAYVYEIQGKSNFLAAYKFITINRMRVNKSNGKYKSIYFQLKKFSFSKNHGISYFRNTSFVIF